MAQLIVRGHTITLDEFSFDGNGDPYDPPDLKVSIIDAFGATVVNLDSPTANPAVGHSQYAYDVPAQAYPGAWAARWFGTIEGNPQIDEDGFTVTVAGATTPPGSGGGTTCTPWVTHEDAPIDGATDDDTDEAYQIASDILFQLSGRRYPGICSDFIRPQAQWRASIRPGDWSPSMPSAPWGFCSCHRGRDTGCASVSEIRLPGHPVIADTIAVKVDGEELVADSDFVMHDGRWLVRLDSGWPCCQNMEADDGEENTFSVAYNFGRLPPLGGLRGAELLGASLYSEMHPENTACSPPSRARQVVRSGITIELGSPQDMIDNGITGIRLADLWLASERWGKAHRPASVLIPGRHRSARRVP